MCFYTGIEDTYSYSNALFISLSILLGRFCVQSLVI